ncbi:MAG: type II toxin-antitoxin system HicB family antitoxin [Candidatus Diapherotrites archaeon]|nr:type II toxin-antitoxin system HicB family antitoxin [Candidatus Diapherotrites archaeon]
MREYEKAIPVSLPVIVSKEGKWFVASCPLLDIATQGKTEKEVKENIEALIQDYFSDPDTVKPTASQILSSSVSLISVPVKGVSLCQDSSH